MRKMFIATTAALATFAALPALAPVKVQAAEFTPQQKKAIEQVVRQYLLNNPEILIEMSQKLEEKQARQQAEQARAALKAHGDLIFRNANDPVFGNPKGSIVVVEFSDYNCPYCRRALNDVKKLVEQHKDVKVVMKEFPILGPGSDEAARIALAAYRQNPKKYYELHKALLGFPGRVNGKVALSIAEKLGYDVKKLEQEMNGDAVKNTTALNLQLAQTLGINGTPAFIIGNEIIRGAVGFDALNAAVERARKQQGQQPAESGNKK